MRIGIIDYPIDNHTLESNIVSLEDFNQPLSLFNHERLRTSHKDER